MSYENEEEKASSRKDYKKNKKEAKRAVAEAKEKAFEVVYRELKGEVLV